jgi:hypothetical protein
MYAKRNPFPDAPPLEPVPDPADKGKTELAKEWILSTLVTAEAQDFGTGLPPARVRAQAKADGVSSGNTWDRAMGLAKRMGSRTERQGNSWRWLLAELDVPDE